MKHLQDLMKQQEKRKQPLPLFSKLKEISLKNNKFQKIQGIPLVQSDNSDHEDQMNSTIQQIKRRLQEYKQLKAKEVVEIHKKSNQSIENIVHSFKDKYKRQALNIINPNLINSHQRNQKCMKELGSTLPNSEDRRVEIETPGFDLATVQKHHQFTIDLRQFTLGQRQQPSSQFSLKQANQQESVVSEFQVNAREPSSRRIKDKIMNSNKNRAK